MDYFSDRERGPIPRLNESIPGSAWGGIVAAVNSRIADGSFGRRFPEQCPDHQGIAGTNSHDMGLAVLAEIPELAETQQIGRPDFRSDEFRGWPLQADRIPTTLAILDLIELCHRFVASPIQGSFHSFFSHYHLDFDTEGGQADWRAAVNRILARNGLAYELTESGRILRLGSPVVTDRVRNTALTTGDDDLDRLLERARVKYLSADPTERSESLEQLWDAFERTKTLLDSDKKAGINRLVNQAASTPTFADTLMEEMTVLTKIGNDFQIRHHETTKVAVSIGEVDYLFHRCFALLAQLLGLNPTE